jgi:hypothetical protein
MAMDTVTLALQGDDVSLDQFAQCVAHFSRMIAALSAAAGAAQLRWEITDLEVGSTTTTARASLNGHRPEQVEEVVLSYHEVGETLRIAGTLPYAMAVRKEADGLLELLKGGVTAIRFETAEADVIISQPPARPQAPAAEVGRAYGAVTGRIQTLTSRSRLRFTLFDRLYDRAVSCYLVEGSEEMMRDAWDRLATVEGIVSRDPLSGRPFSVRQVRNVHLLAEGLPADYKRARGALPRGEGLRAEHRLRRVRDAW